MEVQPVKHESDNGLNAFKLETGDNCFLCWTSIKTKVIEGKDGLREIRQRLECSLLTICRYLKLHPNRIFIDPEMKELIKQFPKYEVSLCLKCGELVEHLTRLCRELELMEMKVNDKLQSLGHVLKRDLPQDCKIGNDYQPAALLRTGIKTKCEAKIRRVLPRVEIEAFKPAKQVDDISSTLDSEEPSVVKIDCGEIDIQESMEEDIPIQLPQLPASSVVAQPRPNNQNSLGYLHPQIQYRAPCNLCGNWVVQRTMLRHRRQFCKFRPKSNQKTECDKCNKKFDTSTKLLIHIRLAHPATIASSSNLNIKEAKCKQCGRVVDKRNMRRHMDRYCRNRIPEQPATDPLAETELEKDSLELPSTNGNIGYPATEEAPVINVPPVPKTIMLPVSFIKPSNQMVIYLRQKQASQQNMGSDTLHFLIETSNKE